MKYSEDLKIRKNCDLETLGPPAIVPGREKSMRGEMWGGRWPDINQLRSLSLWETEQ
jgi:hypothetical protein